MEGREQLPLPRMASYSNLLMKLQIRKHAAKNGVDAVFEVSDVPRSPAINVSSGSAPPAYSRTTPSPGVCASPPGFAVTHGTEIPAQILAALKEAVAHQFKKREEEFLKMVDDAKEKVLVEIRCKAEVKRQRDLEDTLEDFMARVKRQAPMAAAFPNVTLSSHVPRSKTDIMQDLAATSREAARSLMAVVVCNEETRSPPAGEAGISLASGSQNHNVHVPPMERGKVIVVSEPMGVDEVQDKPMIEDRKGKGPAVNLGGRICTRQMTMQEALGVGSMRDQVVPVVHQACDQVMYEASVPDGGGLGVANGAGIATLTPIGN
ncbi:uncharacterized protein [Triticum aestivum]|uniref:uncharacterized protein isoform X1 n=1 Tax=Triticum aestivum TaxID=4565 RepID=UPI001D0276BD|nr:uncharacterized protein LOC123081657 isoform X1 [Triticum aestivum]XP_044360141.1 uncharacterized protein LOC123081657 isoform X1 [Triticum aestivum]XP_044360142.1 uncharacterized protein LOC123081657 isoform X1 [Triticum aestivum]